MDWCAVDEGTAPPRVEIELTEHEGRRSRRDRRRGQGWSVPAAPDPTGSTAPWGSGGNSGDGVFTLPPEPQQRDGVPDGPLRSERNRLVVTALAAGVVALFIGWALGRSGGDGDGSAQTVDGGTTTAENDRANRLNPPPIVGNGETTDDSLATGDTLPAAELPTTTRPRPSTTTTLAPAWQMSAVAIDTRLAGATDRIVGVTDDGGFIEFDLAAGEIRTLAGSRGRAGTSYPPIAGADWILSLRDDGGSARVFIGESAVPEVLNATDPYSIIWQYGTDLFWRMDYDVTTGQPADAVEFDLTGRMTGRTIDIGGMWMLGSDMVGGVLLNTGSIGLYRADAEGSERLPDGQVVAISPTHLLLYSCGENLNTCGLRRVDRASGESQPVPVGQDVLNIVTSSIGWWAPAPATPTISADGGAAIVISAAEGVPEVAIIDLTEGTFTLVGGAGNSMMYANPSAGWSADGRFAYAVVESTLTAFDRTTGESFPVVTTVPVDASVAEVYAIAVRPPPAG